MERVEVERLLQEAREIPVEMGQASAISQVQVALQRGIPGQETANGGDDDPVGGPEGTIPRFSHLFVDWWRSGGPVTSELVDEVCALMQ